MKVLTLALFASAALANLDILKRADTPNLCDSQVCLDAGKHLDDNCNSDVDNLLSCICSIDVDNDYWNKMTDCVNGCGYQQATNSAISNSELRQMYCDAAKVYSSLSTELSNQSGTESATNSIDFSAIMSDLSNAATASESKDPSSAIAAILNTLSALSTEGTESSGSGSSTTNSQSGSSASTTPGSSTTGSSNIAATIGCGSLISLVLLSIL
ncbi:hypothetical protein KGF56_001738 [Candida oxycetoniae]|uniref:Uncharacterized protein n=1 Tax=Candida oxycetoniae TaxID=497107 RepID=A0AAI9SYF0_9ASCO|nr:uncharacterized protein KGF56_001738 [Candida oxycetoniae]KAI3405451.2 hypothetical protein KGF56_001738 [Candida oxycetoniae]